MHPPQTHRDLPSENRWPHGISTVAAGIACWLWGGVAIVSGVGLLVLLAISRASADGAEQPPLFRFIAQGWVLLHTLEGTRLPGLDIEPRRLSHYTNWDFVEAYLTGSALLAFVFAVALWLTASGLAHGCRWAFRIVAALSSVAAVAIAVYAVWCICYEVSADVLALIAIAAAIPAALAVTSFPQAFRPNPTEDPAGRRRNSLTRPLLLLILSAHALLLVPAIACAWVVLGSLGRQVWLAWDS
jgi:hypothetical protein